MRLLTVLLAVSLLTGPVSYGEDSDSRLDIEFNAAIAKISPRASDQPIRLPSLTFEIRATTYCPESQAAESLSISIADTRISINPAGDDTIERSIHVSHKQLGPVAVENFCLVDNDADAEQTLQVDDALTAQLSLLCVGESGESISYETAALSVALECELPDPAQ